MIVINNMLIKYVNENVRTKCFELSVSCDNKIYSMIIYVLMAGVKKDCGTEAKIH